MLNVGRKLNQFNGEVFILSLMKEVMEAPCAACGGHGGFVAVKPEVTGNDLNEPFALPACSQCENHKMFHGRVILGVRSN